MNKLGIAIAFGVALVGASAQAQAIDATGSVFSSVTAGASTTPFADGWGTVISGNNPSTTNGGSVEASVGITSQYISFESGNATSGPMSSASAFSSVDVTITNYGEGSLEIGNFASTIIPAGLGFYIQDRSGGLGFGENIYQGYPQALSGVTFQSLYPDVPAGEPFAYADFDFQITSNDATLYSLSGSLALTFNSDHVLTPIYNLDAASSALSGFTSTNYDPNVSLAYAWDATDIMVPLNTILEYGASQTITYSATVTSYTKAGCITPTLCLVAYSGFGDPIGRGGGVDSLSTNLFAGGDFEAQSQNSTINGIVFEPVFFEPFRAVSGGVPEPSTWVAMLLGFGLLGGALRQRRAVAYT